MAMERMPLGDRTSEYEQYLSWKDSKMQWWSGKDCIRMDACPL